MSFINDFFDDDYTMGDKVIIVNFVNETNNKLIDNYKSTSAMQSTYLRTEWIIIGKSSDLFTIIDIGGMYGIIYVMNYNIRRSC